MTILKMNEPYPKNCKAKHPKYWTVTCALAEGHGWNHKGIIGMVPNRKWIEWEPSSEYSAREKEPVISREK